MSRDSCGICVGVPYPFPSIVPLSPRIKIKRILETKNARSAVERKSKQSTNRQGFWGNFLPKPGPRY